ncbi:MAG: hypothetical protein J6X42_01270 [Alphaproteobacteria bacterium]|nr:hypothetical protein [Alphaproteobacteria bacterium]
MNIQIQETDAGETKSKIHIFPRFDNDGIDTWPKIAKQQYDADEILQKIKIL